MRTTIDTRIPAERMPAPASLIHDAAAPWRAYSAAMSGGGSWKGIPANRTS